MSDEEFSKARQELQDLYIASFPEKIKTFKAELAVISGGDNTAEFEDLRSAAHKIAGSAGSYGFPEVSEMARSLESIIKQDNRSIADLENLTGSLINELEKHIK